MNILSCIFKQATLFITIILLGTLFGFSQSTSTIYECGNIVMYGGENCSELEIELTNFQIEADVCADGDGYMYFILNSNIPIEGTLTISLIPIDGT